MTCYEELKARGLIAQVTNEEEISKMINEGKAVFYIGFDGSRWRATGPSPSSEAVPVWWVTPPAAPTCAP